MTVNYAKLAQGVPVDPAKFPAPTEPTVAQPCDTGLLPAKFNAFNLYGGGYAVKISQVPAGCTPPDCDLASITRLNMPLTNALAIGYKVVRRSDGRVFRLEVQPRDRAQATAWARWFIAHDYEFDAGAAQVHSTNFHRYGLTAETAFDPCASIRAGATILADCYARALPRHGEHQRALRAALSCYQSGNFTGDLQRVMLEKSSQQP